MAYWKSLTFIAAVCFGTFNQVPSAAACEPDLTACGNYNYQPLVVSRTSDGVLPSALTADIVVASRCSETTRAIALNPFATTKLPENVAYEIKAKGVLPPGLTLPATPINLAGDFFRLPYTGTAASLSFTLSITAVESDGDRGPTLDVPVDVTFPPAIDQVTTSPCGEEGCSSSGSAQWASLLGVVAMIATRRRRRA